MLRTIMKPPLFYIKEEAEFELDQVDLPALDVSLCSGLTACTIDLSKSVFRARIYTFEGRAAFLALSIHHVVLDGPSQQIVFSTLSQILVEERLGSTAERLVFDPYDAVKLAE